MNDYKNSTTLASTVSVDTSVRKYGGWNIGTFLPGQVVPVQAVEPNQVHGGNIIDSGLLGGESIHR